MNTVTALEATPGSAYLTPRGASVVVVGPTEDGRVRIRNAAGAHTDVPPEFTLVDPDAKSSEDLVEELALLPIPDLRRRVEAGLDPDVLEALAELRPEPFVLQARETDQALDDALGERPADPACPVCGKPTPTGEVRGKGTVFRGHVGPDGSAYCTGSGQPVPKPVASVDEAARTLARSGGQVEFTIREPQTPNVVEERLVDPDPDPDPDPTGELAGEETDTVKTENTTPTPAEEPDLVLAHLPIHPAEPAHYQDLQEPAGLSSPDKVGRALSTLVTQGRAARVGRGLYVRPAEGSSCPYDPKTNPSTDDQIELVKAVDTIEALRAWEAWPTIKRVEREIERHRTALTKLLDAYREDVGERHLGLPKLRKVAGGKRIGERPGCVRYVERLTRHEVDADVGLLKAKASTAQEILEEANARPGGATLDRLELLVRRIAGKDGSVVVAPGGFLAGDGTPALSADYVLENLDQVGKAEAEELLDYLVSLSDRSVTCHKCGQTVRSRASEDGEALVARHVLGGGDLCPGSDEPVYEPERGDEDPEVGRSLAALGNKAQNMRPGPGQSLDLQEGPEDVLERPQEPAAGEATTEADEPAGEPQAPEETSDDAIRAYFVSRDQVLDVIQRGREEGEIDLRQIRAWIQSLPVHEENVPVLTESERRELAVHRRDYQERDARIRELDGRLREVAEALGYDLEIEDVLEIDLVGMARDRDADSAVLENVHAAYDGTRTDFDEDTIEANVAALRAEVKRSQAAGEPSLDQEVLAALRKAAGELPAARVGELVQRWDDNAARARSLDEVLDALDVEWDHAGVWKVALHEAVRKVRVLDEVRGYLQEDDVESVLSTVQGLDDSLPAGPFAVYLRPEEGKLEAEIHVGAPGPNEPTHRVQADLVVLPPGWSLVERSPMARALDKVTGHRPPVVQPSKDEAPRLLPAPEETGIRAELERLQAAGFRFKLTISSDD